MHKTNMLKWCLQATYLKRAVGVACLLGEVLTKEVSDEDVITSKNTSVVHKGESDDEDKSSDSGTICVD